MCPIAILEDDSLRQAVMRQALLDHVGGVEPVMFESAGEMIGWLEQHLTRVSLISLDHDLPMRTEMGQTIDCGTGREVADYLAARKPVCPVIVHSSNAVCATGMFFALRDAGWRCRRVHPTSEQTWIEADWLNAVLDLVAPQS